MNGIITKIKIYLHRTLHIKPENACGGNAKKDMNGKPKSIIELTNLDALYVVAIIVENLQKSGKMTLYLVVPILPQNGITIETRD